jgi:hypothetical protein
MQEAIDARTECSSAHAFQLHHDSHTSHSVQVIMTAPSTAKVSGRVTKKTRQPENASDITPQRARKRALDREAQRTFREKTKNYIAHLEQTVQACKADDQSQLVKQLLDQNADLYRTIEHLRKVLTDIYTATEPEISRGNKVNQPRENCDDVPPRDRGARSPPADDSIVVSTPVANTTEPADLDVATFPSDGAIVPSTQLLASVEASLEASLENQSLDISTSAGKDYLELNNEVMGPTNSEHPSDVFMCNSQQSNEDLIVMGRESMWGQLPVETQSLFVEHLQMSGIGLEGQSWLPFDLHPPMHLTLHPETELYQNLWNVTNSVYNKIFDITPSQAAAARRSDSGVVFKAIKNGWDTLSASEQENPIVQILAAYDTLVACRNGYDQVNRVAIAFKNYHLLGVSISGF